jgi:hypothetical protein
MWSGKKNMKKKSLPTKNWSLIHLNQIDTIQMADQVFKLYEESSSNRKILSNFIFCTKNINEKNKL